MSIIYEIKVAQTVKGKIFIKADSQKEAEEAANRYIQDEQNIGSINFDEIWDYDIWDVSEADIVGGIEIIKVEDVL